MRTRLTSAYATRDDTVPARYQPVIFTPQGHKAVLRGACVFDQRPDLLELPSVGAWWSRSIRETA